MVSCSVSYSFLYKTLPILYMIFTSVRLKGTSATTTLYYPVYHFPFSMSVS